MQAVFLSYVREVDASGDVTRFRQSLEGAVRNGKRDRMVHPTSCRPSSKDRLPLARLGGYDIYISTITCFTSRGVDDPQ
jgi:hypothetical protein